MQTSLKFTNLVIIKLNEPENSYVIATKQKNMDGIPINFLVGSQWTTNINDAELFNKNDAEEMFERLSLIYNKTNKPHRILGDVVKSTEFAEEVALDYDGEIK